MTRRPDIARAAVLGLAASQHRALTRRQASELGFGRQRIATALAAGWLTEPVPGVLALAGVASTWEHRVMLVVLAAGGHGVASHRGAARLHGLDGFVGPGNATVEVSVERSFRLSVPVTAVTHHVTPLDLRDITTIAGIPCTTMPRTLADLGSVVRDRRQLRQALTSARRKGLDVPFTREVTQRLHRPGQAGTGALLRLLDAIPSEGRLPATWFEELLLLCLDDPGLPHLEPQYPIQDEMGTVVARVDIGIPSVKLGLEAHSRQFHFGSDQETFDEDRDLRAAACGWELLYLGWYATRRPADVLKVVKDVVQSRRQELKSPAA